MTFYDFFPLITVLLNIATLHALLTRAKSIINCIVVFGLNLAVVLFAVNFATGHIHDPITHKYILYFISSFWLAYIYLVFKESFAKKIFAMFTVWMFSTISLFIATPLAKSFSGRVDPEHIKYLVYFFRVCIQIMLLSAIYVWLSKIYKNVLNVVSDHVTELMSLYPVFALILLVNNYTIAFEQFKGFDSAYDMLFFLIFIILGYVLVFAGISSASQIISLKYNIQMKIKDLAERKRVEKEHEQIIADLQKAISEVKQLSGLLPICSSCKKIRNDQGYWEQIEAYILAHSEAEFTHGICPECTKKLYPELFDRGIIRDLK